MDEQQYTTDTRTSGGFDDYQQFESDSRCKNCGQRPIDRTQNPDSVLCGECREKLIKYPIPKKIYAFLALILILVTAGLVQLPGSISAYKLYEEADIRAGLGYAFSTLEDLDALMENYPESVKIPMKMLDIGMRFGLYDSAAYVVNTYIVGKELSDWEYNKVLEYSDTLNRYYDTQDAVASLMEDMNEEPQEQITAALQKELTAMLSDPSYDAALLYYYLAYFTAEDEQASMDYFDACYSTNPCYTDAGVQLANYYRRAGDLEEAGRRLERLYSFTKEDASVSRSVAIMRMLDGDLSGGLSLAEEAYRLDPEAAYVVDTCIVALASNNRLTEAQELRDKWIADGYEFDEDLDAFLAGQMSLEDYYIGE